MMKFTIITGWKYFSNCVTQNSSLITQTKLLTALFKNNIEIKEYSKFLETLKWFLLKRKNVLEYSKTLPKKRYVEIFMRLMSKEDLG